MRNINKLKYCLLGNLSVLILVIILSIIFRDNSEYWNIGPNPSLVIISVHINTWSKYLSLLFIVALINVSRVVIEEIAMPILGFNIYNPDKKIITEFTKWELQFYGNSMYAISNMRQVFLLMLNISQIDIALYNVFICELASIYTIRMLLNEKQFVGNGRHIGMEDLELVNTPEELRILSSSL